MLCSVFVLPLLPLRSTWAPRYALLRGGSIRGLCVNDIAGKASNVFSRYALLGSALRFAAWWVHSWTFCKRHRWQSQQCLLPLRSTWQRVCFCSACTQSCAVASAVSLAPRCGGMRCNFGSMSMYPVLCCLALVRSG